MGTPVPCVRSFVTVCPTIQPCYLLIRYMKDLGTASGVVMSQVESAAVPTLADLALVAAGHRVCTHLALSGGGVYATVGNPQLNKTKHLTTSKTDNSNALALLNHLVLLACTNSKPYLVGR